MAMFETKCARSQRGAIESRKKKNKKEWMIGEILKLMVDRKASKAKNELLYKKLSKEIKEKCSKAKEECRDQQCLLTDYRLVSPMPHATNIFLKSDPQQSQKSTDRHQRSESSSIWTI